MNERIKELSEQATQKFSRFGERDSWEKVFAELIVQECIDALWSGDCYFSDLANDEYVRCSNKIKNHFYGAM